MNEIGDRIRKARKRAALTQAEVASRLGIDRVNITQWESGTTKPDRDRLPALAKILNVSVEWLITGREAKGHLRVVPPGEEFPPDPEFDTQATVGEFTGARGIPHGAIPQIDVTAGMGAGGLTLTSDGVPGENGMTFSADHVSGYWRLPGQVLSALGLRARDIAILPVQGDSMAKTLFEGDFVFVDTRHRFPSPDGVYAIGDEFGGIVVKRLEVASRPGAEDPTIRVISDNPKHKPKEFLLSEMRIIGRVLRRFGAVS